MIPNWYFVIHMDITELLVGPKKGFRFSFKFLTFLRSYGLANISAIREKKTFLKGQINI